MTTDIAALGISLSVDIAEKRSIVFQTHVDQTVASEDLNELLDRMSAAADRQRAKYELFDLLRHRDIERQQFENTVRDLALATEKANLPVEGRRNARPALTVVNNIENLKKTVQTIKGNLDRYVVEIDKRRRLVAGERVGFQEAAE